MHNDIEAFVQTIKESLKQETFVKLSLASYNGDEAELKKILIRTIIIKKEEKLSFTYRYKTRDIVKNYGIEEAFRMVSELIGDTGFRVANLFTIECDMTFQILKNGKVKIHKNPPSTTEAPSKAHDKKKVRKIEATGKQYLYELKITDKAGKVYKATQDKYRQINHYIEILSSLLQKLPNREITKIVDMGSGKGYLTFALYDYLNNVLSKSAQVTGLEYRKDLVDLCNTVAQKSAFDALKFEQGAIENYEDQDINVLIALHACDTATDDAIYKGIKNNADLIVVAPCCHKQIRREIEKHKTTNTLDFLTKYGIFLERQAEMVTDGIRALILNYFGYSTKVVEFISDAHTPKNVLIIGMKQHNEVSNKIDILREIEQTKSFFGITYHHLERKMELDAAAKS